MRPIKFRGKTPSGAWVYGYYEFQELVKNHIIRHKGCAFEVIPETVGQFTGMLDKNGTEVYKGDVVRFTYSYEKRGYYTIVSNTYIGIITLNKFYHSCIMNGKDEYHIENIRNGEVIGNIHDNPELLKGGKQ